MALQMQKQAKRLVYPKRQTFEEKTPKSPEMQALRLSSKMPEMQALDLARIAGFTVKVNTDKSGAEAEFAVICSDETKIPLFCKKFKGGVLLTDGGKTLKTLDEPVYSYLKKLEKGQPNADLLAFTLKALIKKEVEIQNEELTVSIPSYDPSYLLSGTISLFTCIKGISSLNTAIY